MSQQELLSLVVQSLTQAGIEYMVTGSLVSSLQGEPRSTHDIDVVVVMTPEEAGQLEKALPPPNFYLSGEAIQDAIRQRSMFNLLCLTDGEKVVFWMLTEEPFDRSRFARRQVVHVLGIHLTVSASRTPFSPNSDGPSCRVAARNNSRMPCGFTKSSGMFWTLTT